MRFCQQCGKTIAVLENDDRQLCQDCTTNTLDTQNAKSEISVQLDLLSATFSAKQGKFYLESKEGWLLWSGNEKESHSLQEILDRANRILKIRKRKK